MTQEPAGETQRSSPREGRKEGFPAEAKRAVYAGGVLDGVELARIMVPFHAGQHTRTC